MKISIIGSGNVGKALAGSATKAGHEVTIASKHHILLQIQNKWPWPSGWKVVGEK